MLHAHARRLGALILGAAMALPLAVAAQAPSRDQTILAQAPYGGQTAPAQAPATSPAPPATAPTGKVPDNPARGIKAERSTATANGSFNVIPPSGMELIVRCLNGWRSAAEAIEKVRTARTPALLDKLRTMVTAEDAVISLPLMFVLLGSATGRTMQSILMDH